MRTIVRIVFCYKDFICYVHDLYDIICEYISREWIGVSDDSLRSFATNHDIDEKSARRIKDWKTKPYRITLYTLEKICASRDIKLEDFFNRLRSNHFLNTACLLIHPSKQRDKSVRLYSSLLG